MGKWGNSNMLKIKRDIAQNENADVINQKIDNYSYILDSINAWIISADNKVSIYCGMYSAVTAAIAFVANYLLSGIRESCTSTNSSAHIWFVLATIVTIGSFLVSIFFYTWSVKPNLIGGKKKDSHEKDLSLFYRDISHYESADAFIKIATESDRKLFLRELLNEVYYNSIVCTKKMQRFQIAVVSSSVSVFSVVIACIAYYYTYRGH